MFRPPCCVFFLFEAKTGDQLKSFGGFETKEDLAFQKKKILDFLRLLTCSAIALAWLALLAVF